MTMDKNRNIGDQVVRRRRGQYFNRTLVILTLLDLIVCSATTHPSSTQAPDSNQSLVTNDNVEDASSRIPLEREKRKSDRLTAYACENSRLNITCGDGLYLDIIRANYGRFSITICNDHGNTEWQVDCQSARTLRAMQARCSNKNQCDVPVDSSIFGDPCPGTFKYIEVHYACKREKISVSTTTVKPRPHWFPPEPRPPSDWSSLSNHLKMKGDNSTVTGEDIASAQSSDLGIVKSEVESSTNLPDGSDDDSNVSKVGDNEEEINVTPRVIKVKVPKVPFNFEAIQREHASRSHLPINLNLAPSSLTSNETNTSKDNVKSLDETLDRRRKPALTRVGSNLQILANFTQYCPPSHARALFWNWTKAGDTAVLQCPQGSTGFAKWMCDIGPQPHWSENGPTFSECRSTWLSDLDSKLREGVSTQNVSTVLAEKTDSNVLLGGDIPQVARMLKHLSERMHYDIQRALDSGRRESMVTDLVQNVVRVSSNLINEKNHQGWTDLGREESGQAATSLMVALEENAFLLADSVTSEKIIIKPTENILLSIRVMQARNVYRQRFPSVESIESWNDHGDSIELEADSLVQNGDNGAVRAVFATYNQLEKILEPQSSKRSDDNYFVNSKVISASLGRGRHIELSKPARITFRHINEVEDITSMKSKCVYWDYLSNHWSEDGCQLVKSNSSHSICSCNHLTNFALLMAHRPDGYYAKVNPSSPIVTDSADEPHQEDAQPSKPRAAETTNAISKHVSTIVASVATLISIAVIVFFAVMAWKRFRVTHQCRAALENSGLPCFHKTKDMADKDKANKGNFYTVTPKLNLNSLSVNRANGSGGGNGGNEETPELVEAQQFFEHMISLQKNQENLVQSKTGARRSSSANGIGGDANETQASGNANVDDKPTNCDQQQNIFILNNMRKTKKLNNNGKQVVSATVSDPMYPKHNNYSRALSPYNHIYMEIDPLTEGAEGCPVYEPLNHSETYMMSTLSDMSEDNGNYNLSGLNYNSDVSRQSSSRESRPLIRPNSVHEHRNLLQTISGVLHSQSVRLAPSTVSQASGRGCATLHPVRRMVNNHPTTAAIFENNVSGRNTIARLGGQQASRLLQGDGRQLFEAVPLQVTTMNGNQFVRLDFNSEQQNNIATSDFGAGTTVLINGRPGQIQAPVHSQRIVNNTNLPMAQFARPFTENQ